MTKHEKFNIIAGRIRETLAVARAPYFERLADEIMDELVDLGRRYPTVFDGLLPPALKVSKIGQPYHKDAGTGRFISEEDAKKDPGGTYKSS